MASMSEGLSGQAEQLQTTVAFFRIEGGSRAGQSRQLAAPHRHNAEPAKNTAAPNRTQGFTQQNTGSNGQEKGIALVEEDDGFENF
jgi:hypothetical protein